MRKPGNVGERPAPSFLTEEQRAALDAALSKKRAEQRACCWLGGYWLQERCRAVPGRLGSCGGWRRS